MEQLGPDLRKHLKTVLAALSEVQEHAPGNGDAAALASAAAVKLATELASPDKLNRRTLHPYRLRVKELQNILRMASGPSHPQFVEDLGKVKDGIGEWHDWQELALIAQEALSHKSRCHLLTELKRTDKRKYEAALVLVELLRKKYLRSTRSAVKSANGSRSAEPSQSALKAIALLAG